MLRISDYRTYPEYHLALFPLEALADSGSTSDSPKIKPRTGSVPRRICLRRQPLVWRYERYRAERLLGFSCAPLILAVFG
jgi:hypothetical protein